MWGQVVLVGIGCGTAIAGVVMGSGVLVGIGAVIVVFSFL